MNETAHYFRKLLANAIDSGGRDLIFNVRLDRPTFALHVKDSKNAVRHLNMENPFDFKKHLKVLIERYSRPNDRKIVVNESGAYDFDKLIFNMHFTSPEVKDLLGHCFNLTLTVNDRGRVITGAMTIKHTPEEWAIYEAQCQRNLQQVEQGIVDGSLKASAA